MTEASRKCLERGEDFRSTIILLETEFPEMTNKISIKWIEHLNDCFHGHDLTFHPDEDLQNGHMAGDIIVNNVLMGCGRHQSGNPACKVGWEDPCDGHPTHCPWLASLESGEPMARRPGHDVGGLEQQTGTMMWEHIHGQERWLQACQHASLGRTLPVQDTATQEQTTHINDVAKTALTNLLLPDSNEEFKRPSSAPFPLCSTTTNSSSDSSPDSELSFFDSSAGSSMSSPATTNDDYEDDLCDKTTTSFLTPVPDREFESSINRELNHLETHLDDVNTQQLRKLLVREINARSQEEKYLQLCKLGDEAKMKKSGTGVTDSQTSYFAHRIRKDIPGGQTWTLEIPSYTSNDLKILLYELDTPYRTGDPHPAIKYSLLPSNEDDKPLPSPHHFENPIHPILRPNASEAYINYILQNSPFPAKHVLLSQDTKPRSGSEKEKYELARKRKIRTWKHWLAVIFSVKIRRAMQAEDFEKEMEELKKRNEERRVEYVWPPAKKGE